MNDVATLVVPASHPIFAGHFPGRPIVPAVMLLDWVLREAGARAGCAVETLAVREAKFLEPLLPDERAELGVDLTNVRMPFRVLRAGRAIVTGLLERR